MQNKPQLKFAHSPMGRLEMVLGELSKVLGAEKGHASALCDEALDITRGLDPYMENSTTPYPPIIDDMMKACASVNWAKLHEAGKTHFKLIPEMCAGGYEASVLQEIAILTKARTILEVGAFISTTTVALALLPSVSKVVSLDIEEYLLEFGQPFWRQAGVEDKIDMRIGDALESMDTLQREGQGFDLVFIDADKGGYLNYYKKALEGKLLNPGGIIVVDNVLFKSAPYVPDDLYTEGADPIREFNAAVRNDSRVSVIMLPVRDGISIIRRNEDTSCAFILRPYVVLTASDSKVFNATPGKAHNSVSLNQLLRVCSENHAESVAVGFASQTNSWDTMTYSELYNSTSRLASFYTTNTILPARKSNHGKDTMIIAILSPSCKDLLLTLCAAMRLGLGVLLLAPQNTPNAVKELCKVTGATHLVYHVSLSSLARSALHASTDTVTSVLMPAEDSWEQTQVDDSARSCLSAEDEADTVCVIVHTSGSSGTPKPIYRTHRQWTEPLPCSPGPPAFTTTPLFHGGLSDFFRALSSRSTLYVYPGLLAITAANICHSLRALPEPPAYFLSVPYIIDLLAESGEGLERLKQFDMVSTGGSPMPKPLGNRLVKNGVRLISRYGSSECGFLMSSDRDFENDKHWDYLRTKPLDRGWLQFAKVDDDTWTLNVPSDWPGKCTSNQEDGSFATGDVFRKHPSTPHAWLLCGRADDVILMVNGEKTSPAPMEEELRQHEGIHDALVFGSGRAMTGVLVVLDEDYLIACVGICAAVESANANAPAHSRIPPEMIRVLSAGAKFPRASKGTLQRRRAYAEFAAEIEDTYSTFSSVRPTKKITPSDYPTCLELVRTIIASTLDSAAVLNENADLFAMGVTSLLATRVRNLLQAHISTALPTNLVLESGMIRKLAQFIYRLVNSGDSTPNDDDVQLMREFSAKFGNFSATQSKASPVENDKAVVVLTGATGSLGMHLLHQLARSVKVKKIFCLCRASDDAAASKRVQDAMAARHLAIEPANYSRIVCLAAELSDDKLGLDECVYSELSATATLVIHAAWSVNFVQGLSSFEPLLKGLRNLIHAITSSQSDPTARLLFCSSTAAVSQSSQSPIPEKVSSILEDAPAMGYARSKWVAEQICEAARATCLPLRIAVLRVGQLSGDSVHGIWNKDEGWPMLFGTAELCGALPSVDEHPSWLPVDLAAKSILEVAASSTMESPVYHILNNDRSTSLRDILGWMKDEGMEFEIVPPEEWIRRLKECLDKGIQLPLLDMWERKYLAFPQDAHAMPVYEMTSAHLVSPTLAGNRPVSKELVKALIFNWQL